MSLPVAPSNLTTALSVELAGPAIVPPGVAQVRSPFVAMPVANFPAIQSLGSVKKAVAVAALPVISVWSPVFVPERLEPLIVQLATIPAAPMVNLLSPLQNFNVLPSALSIYTAQ